MRSWTREPLSYHGVVFALVQQATVTFDHLLLGFIATGVTETKHFSSLYLFNCYSIWVLIVKYTKY